MPDSPHPVSGVGSGTGTLDHTGLSVVVFASSVASGVGAGLGGLAPGVVSTPVADTIASAVASGYGGGFGTLVWDATLTSAVASGVGGGLGLLLPGEVVDPAPGPVDPWVADRYYGVRSFLDEVHRITALGVRRGGTPELATDPEDEPDLVAELVRGAQEIARRAPLRTMSRIEVEVAEGESFAPLPPEARRVFWATLADPRAGDARMMTQVAPERLIEGAEYALCYAVSPGGVRFDAPVKRAALFTAFCSLGFVLVGERDDVGGPSIDGEPPLEIEGPVALPMPAEITRALVAWVVSRWTAHLPHVDGALALSALGHDYLPVGRILDERTLPSGVSLQKVSVPFGVVGSIYEARPNVTVDIAALALRSGNAVVLRGGTAALSSNAALVRVMRGALADEGVDPEAIQTVDDFGRDGARTLMQARGLVDVLVPRGSAELIETVVTQSTVPVIETGAGVVHIVLDASAPVDWAREIIVNAKVQRPSVCNAVETVLVLAEGAARLIPPVADALLANGVTIHGDEAVRRLVPEAVPANEADWATEHMSLDVSIRVVDDLDAALSHIRTYSTHHTESIITADDAHAERFLAEVDSAVVMANASTRFTDGGEFGFGAEVGISTQKLHARGPMGLPELTSTKWLARGTGQIRT
jgi:glutamate-5-semialdehyde dehydrogenase